MFERYQGGEQALLVHVIIGRDTGSEEEVTEFKSLVASAGVIEQDFIAVRCARLHPKYFIGTGKAQELADIVQQQHIEVVIFNDALSPAQTRNLEALVACKVIDRTSLILDIFSQRARTHEGKLQVELAQLRYIATRLIRGWTHLERQKGGIGLRGPGETQLESDRRLLKDRVTYLQQRLAKVAKQREQNRRIREKQEIATLALVGYTNAGKSTLFNHLTDSNVYAQDQLFATLDPTLRRLDLPDNSAIILADTVGFIRHLPHELIAAFKATLRETQQATLLLHVVDAASARVDENIKVVNEVLAEIDADAIPTLLVMNKIDQLEDFQPRIDRNLDGIPERVWLSAHTDSGFSLLFEAIQELLAVERVQFSLLLPLKAARLRSLLYKMQAVKSEQSDEAGAYYLDIELPRVDWERLKSQESILDDFIIRS